MATELQERYGDQIALSVGRLSFPLEGASSVCPPEPTVQSQLDLGIAVVEPLGPISASGIENLQLSVELTNVSENPIGFSTGAAVGTIFDLSGKVVSDGATTDLTLEEIPVSLGAGESIELPLYASMASCDPAIGYVLPPGDYLIVAEVVRIGGGVVRLHSEPHAITIGDR
ncbi:MAG: hypothetical protein AAF531_11960 [Actinomycetota bacterium]